jgi:hypothetical protein
MVLRSLQLENIVKFTTGTKQVKVHQIAGKAEGFLFLAIRKTKSMTFLSKRLEIESRTHDSEKRRRRLALTSL